MDKMSDNENQKQCCQNPNCCGTGKTPAPNDKRSLILRILISVGVLLVAAGVTAYVLLTRYPGQANTPAAGTAQTAPATSRSAISDLNWVKKIYENPAGCTFTFALLPGEDTAKNATISKHIETLVQQLGKDNKKVSYLVLERTNPEYSDTLNRLLIRETPAVIGLNSTGGIAIIKGNSTPEQLFETYVISTSACCPPSAGNCCGSN